ncbi:DUF664 domain-containing protein [Streptomyces sp. NPDC088915]|uniref:mycothiol transferase n=1 Tax=Streptomyces sp. NPDC088915 TaxID=3365912 RepID=UPI003830BCE5
MIPAATSGKSPSDRVAGPRGPDPPVVPARTAPPRSRRTRRPRPGCPAPARAAEVLDRYRTEAGLADAVISATAADAPPAWWPHHLFGEPHLHTLRDVLLHVITETACHAGHLDAARELLDGRRWMVLT